MGDEAEYLASCFYDPYYDYEVDKDGCDGECEACPAYDECRLYQ